MLALSIRQPFAELILRGIKPDFGELSRVVEYRTQPTRIIGRRFYIYASKGQGVGGKVQGIWSRDLSMRGELPEWMIELAGLPRGVIVGSAMIADCTEVGGSA